MAALGTDVKQLLLQVDASVALAQRNLGQLAAQVDRDTRRMDADLARVDTATGRLGAGFSRVAGVLGTLGIGLGIGAVISAGRNISQFADDVESAANRAGIGVERFQTLTEAFRALEVDAGTVDRVFQRLLATLGAVQNGVRDEATNALDRLGIRARILAGEIRDPAQLLDALAEAAQRAGSQAQFADNLADIFGRRLSGSLVPALRDGGVALHQLEQAMRDSGNVIDEDMIQTLAEANETWDRFVASVQQKSVILAASFINAFAGMRDALADFFYQFTPNSGAPIGMMSLFLPSPQQRTAAQSAGIIDAMRQQIPGALGGRPRSGEGAIDADTSEERARARTSQQAFRDFQAELRRRGIQQAAGLTGFRTADQQHGLHRRGLTPLDGFQRPSRHQAWQALDPTRASHNEAAAYAAANAAGLRGFRIVRESGGRFHYEWTGHGRPGELDFSRNEQAMPRAGSDEWHADPRVTASMQRDFAAAQADMAEFQRSLREMPEIVGLSPEQIDAIATVREDLTKITDLERPDIGSMLSREDQQRLEDFQRSFRENFVGDLLDAIRRGEDLGDALVDAFSRAGWALIESGILDLLSGRSPGQTLIGNLLGFGRGAGGAGKSLTGGTAPILTFGGGKASGGPVSPGSWYMVGEKGPERFIPKVPGVIIDHQTAFGGGQRLYFDLRGAVVTRDLLEQMNRIGEVSAMRGATLGASGALHVSAKRQERRFPTGY